MLLNVFLIALMIASDGSASMPDMSRELEELKLASPEIRLRPVPHYPGHLARSNVGGVVYVIYSYDIDGDVTSTHLGRTSGYEDLDKSALKAVKSWKVIPKLIDGKPVAGEGVVPIRFLPPKSV